MVMKEHVTQCRTVWLTDVFLVFGHQWRIWHRGRRYVRFWIDTHTKLVYRISSLLVWVGPWDLLARRKRLEFIVINAV